MDSGVTRTRISSYRGKFQWTFDQVKWNLVRVNGNLSYPSRNNWQVGWNPREIRLSLNYWGVQFIWVRVIRVLP